MKRALLLFLALSCRGPSDDAVATKDETKLTKKPPKIEKKLKEPLRHRATPVACPTGDVTKPVVTHAKMSPGRVCKSAADCGPSARCVTGYCHDDQCYQDSDCVAWLAAQKVPGKSVCECDPMGHGHRCLVSDCKTDGDCGPGGFCSPSFGLSCGSYHGVLSYHCHTQKDDCLNDDDCKKDGSSYGYCAFEPKSGHWICGYGECDG